MCIRDSSNGDIETEAKPLEKNMKPIKLPGTDNLVKKSLHAAVVVAPDVINKALNFLDTGKSFEELKAELVSATTNKPSFSKYECKADNRLQKGQSRSIPSLGIDGQMGLPIAEPVVLGNDHVTCEKCQRCAQLQKIQGLVQLPVGCGEQVRISI